MYSSSCCIVVDLLALSRCFLLYLLPNVLQTLVAFIPMSLAKDKHPHPFTGIHTLGSVE